MARRRLTDEQRAAKVPRGWRLIARASLSIEPIDAVPVCPSGTLVCALLSLMVPLSTVAEACDIDRRELRRTLRVGAARCVCATCTQRRMGPERLSESQYRRLEAYLGAVVARGTEDVGAVAQAWAIGVRS